MSEAFKPSILDPEDIAELVAVDREQVYSWMSEDKIPYVDLGKGEYKIPLGGFQNMMPQLFDLAGDLEAIFQATKDIDPADLDSMLKQDREAREPFNTDQVDNRGDNL